MEAGPDADEEVACNIQRLLRKGNNFKELVQGVKLMLQVSWCTASVEQAHASVTLVRRMHPDYELEKTLVRAGVHTARRLMPVLGRAARAVQMLQEKYAKALKHPAGQATGRHMYLQGLA